MTKKDFELIARVLNKYGLGELDNNRFNHLTKLFSDTLASKNPRFDKEKFLKACGVEVETKNQKGENNDNYGKANNNGDEYKQNIIMGY